MRARVIVRSAMVGALALTGLLAGSTTPALAAPAVTVPAASLGFPVPAYTDNNNNPVPLPTGPGVSISGDCQDAFPFLFTDPVGFLFTSGNAVFYRVVSLASLDVNGGNLEGLSTLIDFNTGATPFAGHTHFWFGQNPNPTGNSQFYAGDTETFQGSGPGGSSITIIGSGGFTRSASGHQSGWGHLSVTCSGSLD